MRLLDNVRLISNNPKYGYYGISKGDIGEINEPYVYDDNTFCVIFYFYENNNKDTIPVDHEIVWVHVKDLELAEPFNIEDDYLLKRCNNVPTKWCIVEDGFIKNLNGDKKNKIAFDYDS